MSKSIMHDKDGSCYLCTKLGQHQAGTYVEEHHCLNGPNRKLSEHYGLKVYLCLYHHRHGSQAVHNNIDMKLELCRDAQLEFEKRYPDLSFREIFGKNYLGEDDKREKKPSEPADEGFGFIPLSGHETHIVD